MTMNEANLAMAAKRPAAIKVRAARPSAVVPLLSGGAKYPSYDTLRHWLGGKMATTYVVESNDLIHRCTIDVLT